MIRIFQRTWQGPQGCGFWIDAFMVFCAAIVFHANIQIFGQNTIELRTALHGFRQGSWPLAGIREGCDALLPAGDLDSLPCQSSLKQVLPWGSPLSQTRAARAPVSRC
ncbi:hypothetical protein [Paracoccus shandongensis]|uniref:hypothetical protein n=1 Tax=Paracoccus shandongensis TaxID=2816048 RepID=UPI001A9064B2|nr:hypothetical protein [Paracoccus shandongensis]